MISLLELLFVDMCWDWHFPKEIFLFLAFSFLVCRKQTKTKIQQDVLCSGIHNLQKWENLVQIFCICCQVKVLVIFFWLIVDPYQNNFKGYILHLGLMPNMHLFYSKKMSWVQNNHRSTLYNTLQFVIIFRKIRNTRDGINCFWVGSFQKMWIKITS